MEEEDRRLNLCRGRREKKGGERRASRFINPLKKEGRGGEEKRAL